MVAIEVGNISITYHGLSLGFFKIWVQRLVGHQ